VPELKPCPFCGEMPEVYPYLEVGNQRLVWCRTCNTMRYGETEEKAIEAWNTRPNPWHTGIPTEEGWYLLKIKSDDEIIYDTDKLIQCLWGLDWKYAHKEIIKWKKIEEKEQ